MRARTFQLQGTLSRFRFITTYSTNENKSINYLIITKGNFSFISTHDQP